MGMAQANNEIGKKTKICFSTPFDETAVDFLEKLKVQFIK